MRKKLTEICPTNQGWVSEKNLEKFLSYKSVLGIRLRMFLGLLDPDPLVRGTDPAPNPSIIKQK